MVVWTCTDKCAGASRGSFSLDPEASKLRGERGGRLPRAPAHAVGKYVIGFISILILSISYINTYFNKYLRKYYIILIF